MTKEKRILFVTDAFGYGGAEKQLAFVAEGFVNRNYEVAICNLNQRGSQEGIRKTDSRITLFVADIGYKNAIKSNYDYIRYTWNVVKEFKPEIIISFKELGNFCAAVVGKLCGIPSLISERADPYRAYMNAGLPQRIKLWCINHANGGIFQTKEAAAFYSEDLRNNSTIIPNPIFFKDEIPNVNYSNLPKSIVTIGRLDNYQKRYDVMLEAFAIFHERHHDYVLKIYGNGEDEERIKRWISDRHLDGCVQMMGVSNNPIRDLLKEGIFIITSDFEGISNSLLEAMACGLPVVSTDHTPGGARLLITNEENGLLVPTGDANAISDALCKYAENHALATYCGTNAKYVLKQYAPDVILDKWEIFISNNIKKR